MNDLALSSKDLAEATKPKFRVGEKIRPSARHTQFFYEVLKTPETCIYNDLPAYLLRAVNQAIITPPFHRDQYSIELSWCSADNPPILFAAGSHVRHKKSGGIYEIKITPDQGRLEASGEPAYSYVDVNGGPIWHRSQIEMEDGRFEPVVLGTDPINH